MGCVEDIRIVIFIDLTIIIELCVTTDAYSEIARKQVSVKYANYKKPLHHTIIWTEKHAYCKILQDHQDPVFHPHNDAARWSVYQSKNASSINGLSTSARLCNVSADCNCRPNLFEQLHCFRCPFT